LIVSWSQLSNSLFRFKITDNNLCSCGHQKDENHILWEYGKYSEERKIMVKKFNKLRLRIPIDFREILKIMKTEELEIIIGFFSKYKIVM